MKYYLFSTSTNKREIGHYFQTKGLPKDYTAKWFDQSNSMTKLSYDALPNVTPDLKWELEKDAKLTDIVSASNITAKGVLMSEKAKNIFKNFNIIKHIFHNAILYVNDNTLNYFYLQIVNDSLQDINISKSLFCITNAFRMKEDNIDINSFDDLIKKQQSMEVGKLITAEKIYVTNRDWDLLFFPFIHSDIFISERLLNELAKNKITGYKFKEQSIIDNQ